MFLILPPSLFKLMLIALYCIRGRYAASGNALNHFCGYQLSAVKRSHTHLCVFSFPAKISYMFFSREKLFLGWLGINIRTSRKHLWISSRNDLLNMVYSAMIHNLFPYRIGYTDCINFIDRYSINRKLHCKYCDVISNFVFGIFSLLHVSVHEGVS